MVLIPSANIHYLEEAEMAGEMDWSALQRFVAECGSKLAAGDPLSDEDERTIRDTTTVRLLLTDMQQLIYDATEKAFANEQVDGD